MSPTLENLFEFLFKYSPYVYEKGRVVLSASWSARAVAFVLLAAATPGVVQTLRVKGKTRWLDRAFLVGLRSVALGVLVVCLLQPSLAVSTSVPQENFVAILIDDSRSMLIDDGTGEPRSAFVARHFAAGAEGSPLLEALQERFKLRYFRFAADVARLDDITQLGYAGKQTYIGPALDAVRQELASVPLAGLVLISDGADTSLEGLGDALQGLRAASVPVFPVGLGAETFDRDIEIARVEAPRAVLAGSTVGVDVVIEHKGFGGREVLLLVEDAKGVVGTRQVVLPRQGDSAVVKAHFTVEEVGAQRYRFRIAVQDGEMVAENNQRDALIVVEDRRDKVLWYEASPRWDVAFTRRPLATDDNIHLVVLQGTAENKFLRLDVEGGDELFGGFPRSREELFQYRGLIIGNVRADLLTADQQKMIVDFVDQRGGGFMMLGGRDAFAEGGWATTPVAEVLPVLMDPEARIGSEDGFAQVDVQLTLFGKTHPITQLADTVEDSVRHWERLPPLGIVNRIDGAKPGATTLLEGRSQAFRGPQVLLAHQRYGRGKVLAFLPQDSWVWQMEASIPLEDMTHETLWRQLLRWLVQDVPGNVEVALPADRMPAAAPVPLTARVFDKTWVEVNGADVVARVTSPAGLQQDVRLDWSVETDGEYTGTYRPRETGVHEVSVIAARGGEEIGTRTTYFESADLSSEFFDAERRTSLLARIAEETGGRAYSAATVDGLADDLEVSEGGTTVVEVKDLWDMPAVFLLLLGLVATEWGYRKWKGLA